MSARPVFVDDAYLLVPRAAAPPAAEPTHPRMRLASTGSRRRARTSRLQHAAFFRVVVIAVAVTGFVMSYLTLTAALTRTNYQVVRAERERIALQDETLQLDDRLARLRSRDRLADLATKLGMKDASAYAVVEIPRPAASPAPDRSGIAFFPSLAGWIK